MQIVSALSVYIDGRGWSIPRPEGRAQSNVAFLISFQVLFGGRTYIKITRCRDTEIVLPVSIRNL